MAPSPCIARRLQPPSMIRRFDHPATNGRVQPAARRRCKADAIMCPGSTRGMTNMQWRSMRVLVFTAVWAITYALLADAQSPQHDVTRMTQHGMADAAGNAAMPEGQGATMSMPAPSADVRERVRFPEPMRLHTIASMRDHLLALQEIDEALSRNEFDKAANVAEQRLGMSSLE